MDALMSSRVGLARDTETWVLCDNEEEGWPAAALRACHCLPRTPTGSLRKRYCPLLSYDSNSPNNYGLNEQLHRLSELQEGLD